MSDRPKLYYDPRADQPEEIALYIGCARCAAEMPPGESPRSWSRLAVGLTETGAIQVWCVRHDVNVVVMSHAPRPGLDYGAEGEEREIYIEGTCDVCGGAVRGQDN